MKASTGQSLLPGISTAIAHSNAQIRDAAANDRPVFITGEMGTEKALTAKLIHQLSSRANQRYSKINVSWKLPPDLGQYFQQCDGGSLIVHLHKDFPIDMQYTLVEMVHDQCLTDPVSGDMIEADVRIIIMTSLELDVLTSRTPLLPELKELLQGQHIEIPPLRQRLEDIPALVRYALKRAFDTGRTTAQNVDPQVLSLFRHWDWPGNAEDLLLVTAQAAISARGDTVGIDDLPEGYLSQIDESIIAAARQVHRPQASQSGVVRKLDAPPPRPIEAPATNEHDTLFDADDLPINEERTEIEPLPGGAPPAQTPTGEATGGDLDISEVEPIARRVLQLARRLHAQSKLLKKQMSGPIDQSDQEMVERMMEKISDTEALSALERELDRGLEMVHALRRQMALLNMRQQQSAETIRDLVNRITLLSGSTGTAAERDEITMEAKELAESLRVVDEIFQRVSNEIPTFGVHMEKTLGSGNQP